MGKYVNGICGAYRLYMRKLQEKVVTNHIQSYILRDGWI